jgi:hypothetical protein
MVLLLAIPRLVGGTRPAVYIAKDLHLIDRKGCWLMVRSLAVLCLVPEGTLRFEAMPDRRQSPDRRSTQRGGRRKGDAEASDSLGADARQRIAGRRLAHA